MATEPATYPRAVERDDTPAEPVDYAAINAVYGALLTTLVVATSHRAREDPISGRELLPIAAATFALSKDIAREEISAWPPEPLVEDPAGRTRPASASRSPRPPRARRSPGGGDSSGP